MRNRKNFLVCVALSFIVAMSGCATFSNLPAAPATQFTALQKAEMTSLGFLERYATQLKDAWALWKLIEDGKATDGQKAIYEVKRKLLIKAEPLVLGFDKLVRSGVIPGSDKETDVNNVLNELLAAGGV